VLNRHSTILPSTYGLCQLRSTVRKLFQYFCTFGMFDELWSDPGANFMSEVVSKLSEWMGVCRVISLVDRHESNGVEGTNKQIIRHIRTLVNDLRIPNKCQIQLFCR